jgi:hypothetical protein
MCEGFITKDDVVEESRKTAKTRDKKKMGGQVWGSTTSSVRGKECIWVGRVRFRMTVWIGEATARTKE